MEHHVEATGLKVTDLPCMRNADKSKQANTGQKQQMDQLQYTEYVYDKEHHDEVNEGSESDDYDSAEDSLYRPGPEPVSEEEEEDCSEQVQCLAKNRQVAQNKTERRNGAPNTHGQQASKFQIGNDTSSAPSQPPTREAINEPYNTFEGDDQYMSEELVSLDGSSDEEGGIGKKYPHFNSAAKFGSINIELGMEFGDLDQFKDAMRDYNIYLGRVVDFPKNDSIRCRAVCSQSKCDWVCLCSFSNETQSFHIKTLHNDHTCPRQVKNKLANRKWLRKKLVPRLRTQPKLKGPEAVDWFKEEFYVIVPGHQIFRAMREARKEVEGSEIAQYARLRDYCTEVIKSNPMSSIQIGTEKIPTELFPRFDRLYICLEPCKKGFLEGCRPLIGLDGCHLKGYYGGQLLTAVSQDGNQGFFVLAFAIVGKENKDTWRWFLGKLIEDIGDAKEHGWSFISDQQKGLLPAMTELQPYAHHRFCTWHIWQNFRKKWKGLEYRDNYWGAARATTFPEFQKHMEKMKRLNDQAWLYLNNIPPESWTRAAYSFYPKNDTGVNNMCEQFNSKIIEYRGKPIITMVEEIRCYIMRKMNDNRHTIAMYRGPIVPKAQSRLEKAKVDSMMWTPQWVGDPDNSLFEVTSMGLRDKVKVNLNERTCSCRVWQLSGIPCKHAVAALAWNNLNPEDYVHLSYSMQAFQRTYAPFMHPVPGEEYWGRSNAEPIHPPKYARPAGRPRKQRKKDKDEPINPYKLRRRYGKTKCSRCHQVGHNCKKCNNPPVEPTNTNGKKKSRRVTQHIDGPVSEVIMDPPAS